MTNDIFDYMQIFEIPSEAEIFCNNLDFKLFHSIKKGEKSKRFNCEDSKGDAMSVKRYFIKVYK